MLSFFLRPDGRFRAEKVNSTNAIYDDLEYPHLLDPLKATRGAQPMNSNILPFYQYEDFRGNSLPYSYKRPYLDAYKKQKRTLWIETPTHDMMDHFLISNWNAFKGTYETQHPDTFKIIHDTNEAMPKEVLADKCWKNSKFGY